MIEVLSKRFWRKAAVRILPQALRDLIRPVLQGYTGSCRSRFDLSFQPEKDHLIAHITDNISFKVTEELKSDLLLQLKENSDMADEMLGFLAESKDKELLFDIGAARGLFSMIFCATGSGKRSVAFEASPTMIPVAESLIRLNGFQDRILLQNHAIGNTEQQIVLYEDSTGIAQSIPDKTHTSELTVNTRAVDAECERLGMYPDLVKIDVEGYELEVLDGARKLLNDRHPAVCLELHLNYLEDRGISPESVIKILLQYNYQFFTTSDRPESPNSIFDSLKPVVRFIAR